MDRPNPEYVEAVKKMVLESPFPSHMSMRLVTMDIGRATMEIHAATRHLQPFGIVHGGVIATLIDSATFWAVFMYIPQNYSLVNIDLKLNYLRSVNAGQKMRAEGRAIRSGKTISYAEASIYDEEGELLAHGTSTLMALEGRSLPIEVPKFLSVEEP